MKQFSQQITLSKNKRGVWGLDPFKGCVNGKLFGGMGCYGLCYAARLSKIRGYCFNKVVYRYFSDKLITDHIIKKLPQLPFVRMGVMCDPSYDWTHTLDIIRFIAPYQKNIIVVTKHINELEEHQLKTLSKIIFNTSVCALDNSEDLIKKLYWYNYLKKYCRKSVLRVNTTIFNNDYLNNLQKKLLSNENVINTILRFPKNHNLIINNKVSVSRHKYMGASVYSGIVNEKTHFGLCVMCPDQCGLGKYQRQLREYGFG